MIVGWFKSVAPVVVQENVLDCLFGCFGSRIICVYLEFKCFSCDAVDWYGCNG